MFWKKNNKESPTSEESNDKFSKTNIRKDGAELVINVGEIENVCFKKCISNLKTPSLNPAEKSCLDRCANKFKEAIDFGHNVMSNINFKIKDTNNNISPTVMQTYQNN